MVVSIHVHCELVKKDNVVMFSSIGWNPAQIKAFRQGKNDSSRIILGLPESLAARFKTSVERKICTIITFRVYSEN